MTGIDVVHVAGARPNFPKLAPVFAAMTELNIEQELVHTGQHYDSRMSDSFFDELGIPAPTANLGVGSGSHARQTADIMVGLEEVFLQQRPDMVVVYGDVNSTVAAALVASKLHIRVAHVEAGLRSFDLTMPEEVNRMVTDRLSSLHFATSVDAIANLAREGASPGGLHLVGNPMIDTLLDNLAKFDVKAARELHNVSGPYVVGTLHRPGNVDDAADVAQLVAALHAVADQVQVLLPLHPRGRPAMESAGLLAHPGIRLMEPLSYVSFLSLVRGADVVITDSGGVQEETTILGVPCLTLRPNTERPVTVSHGTNKLVNRSNLACAVAECLSEGRSPVWPTPPLWDGLAGARIAAIVCRELV